MTIGATLWRGSLTTMSSEERELGPVAVLADVTSTPLDVEAEWVAVSDVFPAWFWSPEWQAGELEAEADIAAGRVAFHEDSATFLASLDTDNAA